MDKAVFFAAALWLGFAVSVGFATGSVAWGFVALTGSSLLDRIVK